MEAIPKIISQNFSKKTPRTTKKENQEMSKYSAAPWWGPGQNVRFGCPLAPAGFLSLCVGPGSVPTILKGGWGAGVRLVSAGDGGVLSGLSVGPFLPGPCPDWNVHGSCVQVWGSPSAGSPVGRGEARSPTSAYPHPTLKCQNVLF